MRAVVVYESLFGNTHLIADAVAEGLRSAAPEAEVILTPVTEAGPGVAEHADLLVVGGPTHMHGMTSKMSRRTTTQSLDKERKKALEHGQPEPHLEPGAEGEGLRDWFHGLAKGSGACSGAAFDTRIDAKLAGAAAKGIAHRLERHGYPLVAEPEGFIVEDAAGPLRDQELDRARTWGASLLAELPAATTAPS